jgi:hypothetical protein
MFALNNSAPTYIYLLTLQTRVETYVGFQAKCPLLLTVLTEIISANIKAKLSPCLISTTPCRRMGEWIYRSTFSVLDTTWRWMVSFTPQPLYPRGKSPDTHWIRGWVGRRAGLDNLEKRKFLTLPRLELRLLGRPARSQSLYRLHYPGS